MDDPYPHLNEILLEENTIARRLEIQRTLNRNLDTTLMAYFKLNQLDANARQYKYSEIPKHYFFDRKLRTWKPRQYQDQKPLDIYIMLNRLKWFTNTQIKIKN